MSDFNGNEAKKYLKQKSKMADPIKRTFSKPPNIFFTSSSLKSGINYEVEWVGPKFFFTAQNNQTQTFLSQV